MVDLLTAEPTAVDGVGARALRRWMLVVATVAAAAAALGVPAWATASARTTADEPQYLLTAQSLADDVDLDISDELAARAYTPYHRVTLDEQTVELAGGRRVSPHDPLLPVLLAVPVAVGGWVGAKLALAVVAAATAALALWIAVRRAEVSPEVAALVVGGAAASMPLAPYGSQVYPELPAALAVLVAVAAITAASSTRRSTVVAIAAIVALPWLAVKYVPVAAVLGGALLVARRRTGRPVLPVLASVALAAATYALAHRLWYGGWTVYATGDHFAATGEFSVVGTHADPVGRSRRIAGLLVDREFGIAVWSPLWWFAPVAVGALVARRSRLGDLVLATVAVGWATATFVALTMHGWWMPGRQIVVVLPLLAVAIAITIDRHRTLVPVAALAVCVGVLTWVWVGVEAALGHLHLVTGLDRATAPAVRLARLVTPSGRRGSTADDVLLAAWAAVLVGLAVAGHRLARRAPRRAVVDASH